MIDWLWIRECGEDGTVGSCGLLNGKHLPISLEDLHAQELKMICRCLGSHY